MIGASLTYIAIRDIQGPVAEISATALKSDGVKLGHRILAPYGLYSQERQELIIQS